MADEKKSFVLYFDMYPGIRRLPMEQRGEVLSAVFEYAALAAEGKYAVETVYQLHPGMNDAARMAFLFIAETIRRDTEKWHGKHLRYQQAAKNRWAGKTEEPQKKPFDF